MEDHGQNVDLPPEIIHDIISRLPVKPLCRFKCVSKPWRSLISDPDFIAKYSKAVENKDVFFQRRRLVFSFGDRGEHQHGLYSLDLDQFLNYKNDKVDYGLVSAAEATELDFVYNHRGRDGWVPIFHSCNGLLLSQLRSARDLGLVNPVTKKSKKLPKTPTWRLPEKPFSWWLNGFGFDYSTNEYKVVNGQYYDVGIVFSVYTLETDSWRQIECLFPYKPRNYDGIALNGGVHWLVWTFDSLAILSFDLAQEEVREIPLPPIGSTSSIHLGVFRDWLCITLSAARPEEKPFDVFWVMKEYGVRKSWTKMRVSKPYHQLSHTGFWTQSHDLMVFDRSSLVMYNFNDSFWDLSVPGISNHGDFCNVGIYVESLIPSLIDQEQHKRWSKEDLVKKGVNKLNALSDILYDSTG